MFEDYCAGGLGANIHSESVDTHGGPNANADLVGIQKCGSGPDRKMRIWSRAEMKI